jgi:hypothetical protein
MQKNFISATSDGIKLNCGWLTLGLFLIFLLTSFNGFFDSVSYEYGATDYWECTFLGDPSDRHADLIKGPISVAAAPIPNIKAWPPHYQKFYFFNPFGKMEDIPKGHLTLFVLPPLLLLIATALLQAVILVGPVLVAMAFYLGSLIALGLLCLYFIENRWERIFGFGVLALSYPFMSMLARANLGSALVGLLLVVSIYLACTQRSLLVVVICLAVACNIRPNVVLLSPLLLCFGLKRAVGASVSFLVVAGIIAAISYAIAVRLYPGYSLQVFLQALGNYKQLYMVGPGGDSGNNSAYGAIKALCNILDINLSSTSLDIINDMIVCGCILLIALGSYKLCLRRITSYYFAFLLVCLYILASTIFATYHLLVLCFFILTAGSESMREKLFSPWVFLMTILILIPKNYIFLFSNVSIEVILNPIILLVCVSRILFAGVDASTELLTPKISQ